MRGRSRLMDERRREGMEGETGSPGYMHMCSELKVEAQVAGFGLRKARLDWIVRIICDFAT